MEGIVLQAVKRQVTGKQVRALRRQGFLPAVIYGLAKQPTPVSLNAHEAGKVLPQLGSSTLVVVDVEGVRYNALVQEKQRHPVTGNLIHIDFKEVSMTEKLRTMVRVELEGVSLAVKELGGILVTPVEALEIECLPGDLPEFIHVSLAGLKEIGDVIRVGDLVPPAQVEFITDADEVLAVVTAPISEEEYAETEAGAEEPEVIEKGKKEEEEE